jgi:uncharacterized protein (DUF433 family)
VTDEMSPVGSVTALPPVGRYLAHEIGRLAGVSGQTIGQWARRSYISSSVSDGRPRVYSFQDVAEAMVVHELLERGAEYREIKSHITALRQRFGKDWPLTQSPVRTATVGGTDKAGPRIVSQVDDAVYATGERGWQQQVDIEDLRAIADWLRRGGWAARNLEDLDHIEVNPDRLSGRPTIRDRRIAAEDVAEIADSPGGVALLRSDYELSEDEISDARRWWAAVQEYEQAA